MNPKLVARRHPLQRLVAAWRKHGHTRVERLISRLWRLEAMVSSMDDVPPGIRSRRAYLVATATRRKWLVFDCPCGNGHRIILNLDRSRRPVWTVRLSKRGALTLHPSVNYRDDRRVCHYVLSNGRVEWAGSQSLVSTNRRPHSA